MKIFHWRDIRPRLAASAREIVAMAGKEAAGWLFVFKTTLAILLAMWISLRFELGQPVTAMVTVIVIMQPQTGMVLTKSLYRVFGTVAGTLACLLLFALFPQERVLFLLGLSLWVGLCTSGAALNRNFRCYGFVLAGYTAAMIGMPLVAQPSAFFPYAVNRFTEVVVGILCAALVSDLVFPQHLSKTIAGAIQGRYTEFIGFVHALFCKREQRQDLERMHLRFIGSVLSLESLRGAAFLEARQTPREDARLRRLNSDFMTASTTLHSFYQLLKRLRKIDSPAAQALVSLSETLADAIVIAGAPACTPEEARKSARRISSFRGELPQRVENLRHELGATPDSRTALDFDTGVELVQRLAREIHDYTRTYAEPPEQQCPSQGEELRFASRTEPAMALLSGVRAMLAVLLVAAFWIATAWPYGASAVMMVAIGCALFAPAADPVRAVRAGTIGVCIGFPAAFVCKIFILPSLEGFVLLCAAMVPFLLAGAWLSLSPKTAMIGLGYSTMFCFMIAPGNTMKYDPVQMINYGTALILGLAGAAAMFATFMPATASWLRSRLPRIVRRQMQMACFAPLPGLEHRFESSTRDLLRAIAAAQNVRDAHDRLTLDWMFSVLELGRAVIHLRRGARAFQRQGAQRVFGKCTSAIERLFRQPTATNRNLAISTVTDAIDWIREEAPGQDAEALPHHAMRLVLTSLHAIRITLLDNDSVPAAAGDGLPAVQGDSLYAT